ncbi:hypothetical protein BJ165DRAFT_1403852 [Panaeolus papilionaceus]|nr:hypothetical protein BJ165DRAFT_1403852 [Panaeolus papilionaceus]
MLWLQSTLRSLAIASTLLDAGATLVSAFHWDNVKYVYAFGDSYSFVQGTLGYANFSFIGDMEHPAFTPGQLLTNQIIPRNLWDFAFAGADISGKLLPLHHVWTIPLVDQVDQWSRFAADVIPHPDDRTLTTWWIGINDTGDTLSNTTITDFDVFWNQEMDTYFQAVQKATRQGLRTHLFLNVPPGERAPASNTNPTKAATQKSRILQYNRILAERIELFKRSNPNVTVLTFDAHAWFNKVLDTPQAYGFTNVTGFCTCANPEGYFWYNSGHPTERTHLLLAEAIEESFTQ